MHFFSKTLLRAGGRLHFEARGATAARPQPETWKRPNITAAERFRYLYSEDELRGWVGPILALAEQAERVHVLMNNCYRDYAVRNARHFVAVCSCAP
jgi:uncharacterized protein YecE (DUF72 family)